MTEREQAMVMAAKLARVLADWSEQAAMSPGVMGKALEEKLLVRNALEAANAARVEAERQVTVLTARIQELEIGLTEACSVCELYGERVSHLRNLLAQSKAAFTDVGTDWGQGAPLQAAWSQELPKEPGWYWHYIKQVQLREVPFFEVQFYSGTVNLDGEYWMPVTVPTPPTDRKR